MKSEERHRLEQNALADWLGQVILSIKPYGSTILVVAVALTLVLAVTSWWRRSSAQGNEAAWEKFYTALRNATNSGDPRPLKQVADGQMGTAVGHWAAVAAADIHLVRGTREVFTRRSDAIDELKRAVEAYSTVLDESRDQRLRARAYFGRARAHEAMAGAGDVRGNLEKAIADYEQVRKTEADGAYAKLAAERLKQLQSPETRLFYEKLAAYQPPPPKVEASGGAAKPSTKDLPDEPPPGKFSESVLNATEVKAKPAQPEAKKVAPSTPAEPKKDAPAPAEATKTEPSAPSKPQPPKN
jgi:tetratricopeptide (TPR) repeat protein